MNAFVITLRDNQYSERVADRCIQTANDVGGIKVRKFYGVDKGNAEQLMEEFGLKWTWAKNNTANDVCSITGLHQFPYAAADLRAKIGCSMSHFLLWKRCVNTDQPILILEHDAVFVKPMPKTIYVDVKGICQVNDPAGATRKGSWWSQQMKNRGGEGVFEKTWVTTPEERHIPDGLAGNSAYIVKPWAAQELINKVYELGVWPNDATICKQIFPYLEEYYPFITKVQQSQSTTVQ